MKPAHLWSCLWSVCLACSACSASPNINVGNEGDGSVAGSGGASGFGGIGGVGGFGGGDNTLTALVTEPPSEMAIEVVTISCAGECKQVLAVATGGNDPYTFAWNDGVTTAAREICADDTTTFTVTVTDTAFVDDEFNYEAQTVTANVEARVLTCPSDGGVDAGVDAGAPDANCEADPVVQGLPDTVTTLVNGPDALMSPAPVLFAGGATLPAGRYRVTYVDGCLMYSFGLGWCVSPDTVENGMWLVGAASTTRVFKPPVATTTLYPDFAQCVTANQPGLFAEFDFAGGVLGLWLNDSPYLDNVPGESGRNPSYRLEYVCP